MRLNYNYKLLAKIDTNLKLEMYDKMSDTAPKIGIDQKPNSNLYLLTTIRHASNCTTLLQLEKILKQGKLDGNLVI